MKERLSNKTSNFVQELDQVFVCDDSPFLDLYKGLCLSYGQIVTQQILVNMYGTCTMYVLLSVILVTTLINLYRVHSSERSCPYRSVILVTTLIMLYPVHSSECSCPQQLQSSVFLQLQARKRTQLTMYFCGNFIIFIRRYLGDYFFLTNFEYFKRKIQKQVFDPIYNSFLFY